MSLSTQQDSVRLRGPYSHFTSHHWATSFGLASPSSGPYLVTQTTILHQSKESVIHLIKLVLLFSLKMLLKYAQIYLVLY
jgi:hypothetical protein